jgi:GNAT superfamily N-acetyltransferase
MTPEDIPQVLSFFEKVNPNATREQISSWTRPILKNYPHLCWVAVIKDELVGAITAELRFFGVPFIEDLFVSESHRRQGVGSRLIHRVLDELRRMGVPFVKVESSPSTWPLAQKLYYRHGFRVCGVEQDRHGFGPKGDSVILKKIFKESTT